MAVDSIATSNIGSQPNVNISRLGNIGLESFVGAGNFSNDLMAGNLDFRTMSFGNNSLAQIEEDTYQASGNNDKEAKELTNEYLKQQNPSIKFTDKGNPYMPTNAGKYTGTTIGALTPTTLALFKARKSGAALKTIFNKNLFKSSAALAVLGLGIGWVIDQFANARKENIADKVASDAEQQLA